MAAISSAKLEFPPLLPAGLHPKSLAEVRGLCVNAFPLSTTRAAIMADLEKAVQRLVAVRIRADVWVDGSFLTEKINADDVDIVVCAQGAVYDGGSAEQREALDWVKSNLKYSQGMLCDSYVFYTYPESDSLYWVGEMMRAYWMKQYGFNRTEDYFKGIAVVVLAGGAP